MTRDGTRPRPPERGEMSLFSVVFVPLIFSSSTPRDPSGLSRSLGPWSSPVQGGPSPRTSLPVRKIGSNRFFFFFFWEGEGGGDERE